ncbi:MAG: flagellar FlbD family protein [Phycisphaerales bacterium]|nr:flagellar FlbD family protein [Phycisphaerales bacterium]
MISLTKLDGSRFVLNADLIRVVEERPDTVITLTSGDRIMVTEAAERIIAKVIAYRRSIHSLCGGASPRCGCDASHTDPAQDPDQAASPHLR